MLDQARFQSTRPCGARLALSSVISTVSIHAPVWGATSTDGLTSASRVSIHAPVWGATSHADGAFDRRRFQSTRPRGARPRSIASHSRYSLSFNPRARVGRDQGFDSCIRPDDVSIHAPAWGATRTSARVARVEVSIHAPVWGATTTLDGRALVVSITRPWGRDNCLLHRRLDTFQSTRPCGARPPPWVLSLTFVSIHAPVWGATLSARRPPGNAISTPRGPVRACPLT